LRVWARPLPALVRPRVQAERLERFRNEGDAAPSWPNHVIRDARHLDWRYADSPKGYDLFEADGGYAVLGHKLHRGQPIALVADLVAADVRPLLRACIAATRRGSRALFALPATHERVAYASLGFVPTSLRLRFMGKPLAGALAPDKRAWRFTLGDTDFF
jgi:hypothetical protein